MYPGILNFMKRLTAAASLLVVWLTFNQPISAQTTREQKAAKMKAEVEKVGTGTNARLKVRLNDGTVLKGYVSKINENTFVMVVEPTGTATEIEYADAVKGGRPFRLPLAAKIALGLGAALGGFILICAASQKCQN
jgi:hypothetical protein